jgi:KaiC/GvpD/RAD55 family RecA-like ATPase
MLLCGRAGSGKTVAGLQFLHQGLKEDEKGLILSAWRAQDLMIFAESLGFPMGEAITTGRIVVLEYVDFVPGRDFEGNLTLPPHSFMQLQEIVETQAISRVVFDTILPWVAIEQVDRLAEHIYSFVHAFERLGATAMFTLPKPVSAAAFTLKNRLEDILPVVAMLGLSENQARTWLVTKYLGEPRLDPEVLFSIVPGRGITDARLAAAPPNSAAPGPQAPPPATTAPGPRKPIMFSSVMNPRK